ncbi:hypothetical protein [Nocardia sp. AG03]|uniref:hypothetical protein n=1 Tax=Nocardia sp. AG03 TaxID=3025312 RepID=UPI0024188673|nr:hypothetical protein [Nocardia sp. AG03]
MTGPDNPPPGQWQPAPPPGYAPPPAPNPAPFPAQGNWQPQAMPSAPRKVWPAALGAGLGGMVLAGGIVAGVAAALWPDPPAPDPAAAALAQTTADREAARLASCEYARTVSTYDHTDLDDYFAQSAAGATDPYRTEFDNASQALRQAMEAAQVSSRVEDLNCFYKSGEGEEIVIVDIMSQFRRSSTQPLEEKQTFVIEMTMRKVGDRWLCGKMNSPMLKK